MKLAAGVVSGDPAWSTQEISGRIHEEAGIGKEYPGVNEPTPSERVPTGRLIAYSLLEAPQFAIVSVLSLFLTPVYGALGISVGLLGAILFATRMWDVVTDPLIGWLSDRTPGRFGRRRPWILIGAPLTALAVVRVFRPPAEPTALYLIVWLVVLWLGWTMVSIPYYAWGLR